MKAPTLSVLPLLVGLIANSAFAEDTAAKACNYYLDGSAIQPASYIDYDFTDIASNSDFISDGDTKLERYQRLIKFSQLVELYSKKASQSFELVGYISLAADCIVDMQDRRVLEIHVFPGPQTDLQRAIDDTRKVRVVGAKEKTLPIGLGLQQGRF